jgi:hypothetical protein
MDVMKFISTKVHGVLDYMMGILLIASPWIFGFADGGMQTWTPIVLGLMAIIYSLMTDYELGLSDNIRMRTHLILDFMSGLLLAASPWLFGFAEEVYLPHLILGIAEIGAAMFTTSKVGGHARLHHHTPNMRMGNRHTTVHG